VIKLVLCPECESENIKEDIYSPDSYSDGQGYEWATIFSYYCEDCGCEFDIIERTKVEIEINKHGNFYYSEILPQTPMRIRGRKRV